jgi:putative tricarboxylic transport membrane protein
MRAHESLLGLVLVVLAAAFVGYTVTFPDLPGQRFGPSLFPRLIGTGLAVAGFILIVRGWRSGVPWVARDAGLRDRSKVLVLLSIPASVLIYIAAAPRLGFLPVAAGLVAVLGWWFGARAWVAATAGVATALVVQWFFGSIMRVPLPRGLFMQLLFGG